MRDTWENVLCQLDEDSTFAQIANNGADWIVKDLLDDEKETANMFFVLSIHKLEKERISSSQVYGNQNTRFSSFNVDRLSINTQETTPLRINIMSSLNRTLRLLPKGVHPAQYCRGRNTCPSGHSTIGGVVLNNPLDRVRNKLIRMPLLLGETRSRKRPVTIMTIVPMSRSATRSVGHEKDLGSCSIAFCPQRLAHGASGFLSSKTSLCVVTTDIFVYNYARIPVTARSSNL